MPVLYSCTDALRDAARDVEKDEALMAGLAAQEQAAVRHAANQESLSPSALQEVSQALRAAGGPCLHGLLQGSRPTLPDAWLPPKPKPKSAEQIEYLKDLHNKTAERNYQQMISGVTRAEREAKDASNMAMKDAMTQLGMGFNVIAAMATAFVAGHFCAGMYGYADHERLVVGLFCLIGMLFIEVVLLMIYVYQNERELMPHEKAEKARIEGLKLAEHMQNQANREAAAQAQAVQENRAAAPSKKGKGRTARAKAKKAEKAD